MKEKFRISKLALLTYRALQVFEKDDQRQTGSCGSLLDDVSAFLQQATPGGCWPTMPFMFPNRRPSAGASSLRPNRER
ncbi:hypothetical protein Baya_15391 [Bagarius yarrelli]|uniref:Uncharacterized protein n=1 Tax=Bagarius yarrelli TaxID=175774 RepID=A0A556VBF5_BAGYA|nr:hypothetical protein Baya_15391 [Bagarius yarrelli]